MRAMRIVRRVQLVFLAAFIFSAAVAGKCVTGTVIFRGRLINLPPSRTGIEATVIVHDRKGTVTRSTSVSNGEFTVEAPFSTTSSSTLLLGDRCNAVPTFIELKIVSTSKVVILRKLDFKSNFEMTGPSQYRLKQELSLSVPKDRTDSPK